MSKPISPVMSLLVSGKAIGCGPPGEQGLGPTSSTTLTGAMGQPVAVVTKPSHTPGLIRFEANRSLTGMGHERFHSAEEAIGPRPAAELARRLFETGRVDYVHVYQNVATVDLRKG